MPAVLTPAPPAAPFVPAVPTVPAVPVAPVGGPQPLRFTLDQYRALGALDAFRDLRTVLVDGVIYVMPNPNPPHDTSLSLVAEWLRSAFPTGYYIRNQMGLRVGAQSDPGPDLAVVVGSIRDYATRTPTEAVLVVEVADTTLFFDTTTKAEAYATAGVRDYWVADLDGRRLLVYRDPEPLAAGLGATAYRTHRAYGPDDTVAPLAAPTAEVRVADLLP